MRPRSRFWVLLAALAVTVMLIWTEVLRMESRRGLLWLHVLDVGQGDALFIEAPDGAQTLIDGGPDRSVLARLGEIMPFWDRSIDLVVLTHPHADHLDGLVHVLERYDVGMILESGVGHTIPEYAQWREEVRRRGIQRVLAARGQVMHLGGGATLSVLAPFKSFDGLRVRDIHDAAVVTRLEFASSTALLMADAEVPIERMLIAAGDDLRAGALKVGHHGSKTSTGEPFLRAVSPDVAVIPVGRRNRYGHPHPEVLERLERFGVRVFRTDRDGTVTLVGDGVSFRRR